MYNCNIINRRSLSAQVEKVQVLLECVSPEKPESDRVFT